MMGYGYENEQGDRISALIDMINGGGPGRSGDTFEGGGILSLLANAVAQPYGSVRERPGHPRMGGEGGRPMGAPPMTPRTPAEVREQTLLALETPVAGPGDVVSPVVETRVLGAPDGAATPAGAEEFVRFATQKDLAALDGAHPDVVEFFSGLQVGDPLFFRGAMIIDALRASRSMVRRPGPESGEMPMARLGA